jgi:hypothetical protein
LNRIRAYFHIGAWVLLGCLHACAQVSVQLVGLDGRAQPTLAIPAVFSDSEQKLDLNVGGVPSRVGTTLYADLFQVAGSLARPISTKVQLEEAFALSPVSPYGEQVKLKFPKVTRQTEIRVRLTALQQSVQASGIHQANPVVLGNLRFEIFPPSVTQELKDLIQPKPDGAAPMVVFGPGQKLRHFLTGLHVPFEDGGTGTPDRFDPNRLYFGELATNEQFQLAQDQGAGARMVLFSPDESLPAGVYAERFDSGVLIHVTSPLLDNLDDDPRSQLGLIKIIHFLSAPLPSAN